MSTEIFSLAGKRVLVTGASSGLGAHFARTLAAAGADVILAARRTDKLEETASAVRELGREATTVPMDVGDYESVESAFLKIPEFDVLINNAGINRVGQTHELSKNDWDAVIDTNLNGVWHVTRFALNRWLNAEKPGNIINVASILGLRVSNQLPAYTSTKAAVVQLTKSIALDYARYGIRANAICPGYFETEMNSEFMHSEAGQKLLKRVPYRRMGEKPELDGPLLLLASDASSYMSGVAMPVDGAHACNPL
jgi:NAD(P)-dependent dehydrogenase (short-subunit alcohol dehydrogenase family)